MRKYFRELVLFTILVGLVVLGNTTRNSSLLRYSSASYHKEDVAGKSLARDKKVKVLLGGDVMLGRTVTIRSLDRAHDPTYPFSEIKDYTNSADIFFVNLENPIVENCPRHFEGFTFCAPPSMLEGLNKAGVNVVNLANNHIRNYGSEGLDATKRFLEEREIDYVGSGDVTYFLNKGGMDFAFVGFDFLTYRPTDADYELVRKIDKEVDVLIAAVHWGNEYTSEANSYQAEIARKLVENGADVVAGHHPHWVQNAEMIADARVYYSLGNLVFDQMWSEETKKGLLVELTFEDGEVVDENFINTYMKNWAQPVLVENALPE